MKLSPLKRLRLARYMTQTEVAEKVGVSQPNYQRWEAGTAPIPAKQLKRLAKALGTSTEEILGKPRPFDHHDIDDSTDAERRYYGEAAFHFASRARPLLLPISVLERDFLHKQLHSGRSFVVVESLDDRTVLIRRTSVTDVYISSDAFDTFGPESDSYYGHLDVHPDERFWRIIEYRDYPEGIADEYDTAEVDAAITRLDAMSAADREEFVTRATTVEWQMTTGQLRSESELTDAAIEEAFDLFGLGDASVDVDEDERFFHYTVDGYHRSVFINTEHVEWLSIPTHRLNQGRLEAAAEELG